MLTSTFLVYRQHPSQAQIRLTSGVALALFLASLATLLYARQPLLRIEAFLPVVNTTLVVGYLSTATLLFAQARALRFAPLYLLGAAYFFNGLMTVSRCLTFPGTFAAQGLLGARADTSLWLGNAGLAGFSIAILAYAWNSRRESQVAQSPSHSALSLYLIATVAAALLLTLLTTAGAPLLPLLTASQGRWAPGLYIVETVTLLLTAAAMVALLLGRRPVLDLWLLIVLWIQLLESVLVLLSSGRFTAGWYVGQVMGMLSGLFVFFTLLAETNLLYGQIVDQLKAERREQEGRLLIREAAAASIAHELRQPIAAIMLSAQVGQMG